MAIDFKVLAKKAAAVGPDMNKEVKGGGEYKVPAAGLARLRFVSYIEVGQHEKVFQGQAKLQNQVWLTFELSGPKHQPTVTDDGTVVPIRITVKENLSLNSKAHFFKLFKRMNYDGQATHMAELLGQEFIGTVVVQEWEAKGSFPARKVAQLRDDAGYTIRPPYVDDPETGETRRIAVDPCISDIRMFVWDIADREQWDSTYIAGEYEEKVDDKGNVIPAKSKNVYQDTIRAAKNFAGSPIEQVLNGGDVLNDVAEAQTKTPAKPAEPTQGEDDDLNGVV